jgi:hypothetical protein
MAVTAICSIFKAEISSATVSAWQQWRPQMYSLVAGQGQKRFTALPSAIHKQSLK